MDELYLDKQGSTVFCALDHFAVMERSLLILFYNQNLIYLVYRAFKHLLAVYQASIQVYS